MLGSSTSFVLRGAGPLARGDDFGRISALRRKRARAGGSAFMRAKATRFVVVAGLRFDTGYNGHGYGNSGPRWTTRSRPAEGCVIRHPEGL